MKALVGAFNKAQGEGPSRGLLCEYKTLRNRLHPLFPALLEAAAPLSLSPRPRLSISGNYESFDNPPLFWKTVLSKILRAENSLLLEITFNGAPCWTEASKGPIVMDGLQYIIQLECKL